MARKAQKFESTFDTYEVTRQIGEGGCGRVYEVVAGDATVYAVKCLSPERMTTEKRKRFQNELGFCEKSQHPNIIKVVDHGFMEEKDVKCPFYVMPLYQNTLRAEIKTGIPKERVLPLFAKILDAIEAAHLKGVWHRDLKPENILLGHSDEDLVVADWGVAHFEEEDIRTFYETKPAEKLGNFAYAAPEQRLAGKNVSHAADVYALGVILNELFTQQLLQGAGYRTISDVHTEFGYLDAVVDRMVQQNPQNRYANIADLKNDLIARGNEFIALQKLDKLSKTVVPATQVNDPFIDDPPQLINLDYRNGQLILTLSRWPNTEWKNCFVDQGGNFEYIQGKEPKQWAFMTDQTVAIKAEERQVQPLTDHFKQYVVNANRLYKSRREEEARRREKERRIQLERERTAEEARLRVLKSTSI